MTTREREADKKVGEESQRMGMSKAVDLQKYLQGAIYPAEKQKIMDTCKRNGCPEEFMSALKKLPEKQYKSAIEVEEEYNKIK